MKTVYLHGSPDYYGSGKVLLEILRFPGNAENAIVIFPHEGPLCAAIRSMGIPLYIINMGVLRRKYFTPWGIIGRLFLWIKSVIKIRKIIQQEAVTCIYVNSLNVVIGPWLKTNKNSKLVWHLHEIIERPRILYLCLHQLLQKADKIIAVSKATQQHWESRPLNKEVHLLYNGFSSLEKTHLPDQSTSQLKEASPSSQITLGMIGRVQAWKGQSYLLDIIQELRLLPDFKKIDHFKLLIAGDPYPGYEYLAEALKKEIQEKKLDDLVEYLGYQEDVTPLLQQLDLLIVPSQQPDPLPTVVLEGMFAQLPVVATRQGGSLEMIQENVSGYFIPLQDAKASSKILLSLLLDKKGLKEAGIQGKQRAEALFSITAFRQGWLRIMKG
jgi:glycosyltransferase involved in cell wall biosynthesis